MNQEYEFSFKVKSITPFTEYCERNHYELKKDSKQTRILYENGGKVMARITKNTYHDKEIESLDLKDCDVSDHILKVRRETKELIITDENRDFVESLLDIFELKETKKLIRKRYVYQKNSVTFEIDHYLSPMMNVVAIEGKKEEVDVVYQELKNVIASTIVNE